MVDLTFVLILLVVLVAVFFAFLIGIKWGAYRKNQEWLEELPNHRKDAISKSRAVIGGQFSENIAPFLPGFKYLPTECRFLGKPTDFIVFKGMDKKKIDEIIFVEVKSGNAKLSEQEKNLKDAIERKRVRFEEYRVDKTLTESEEDE